MDPEFPNPLPANVASAEPNDLFDAANLTGVVDLDEFKHFLDHLPVAVLISKTLGGEPRTIYANAAFEANGPPPRRDKGKELVNLRCLSSRRSLRRCAG